jgi:streptogramin lyase
MRAALLAAALLLVAAAIASADGVTPGSGPIDVAAGPDGNLWFTERAVSRIGLITPSGQVTEFGAGITPGSRPEQIASGPDGNLWFTESGSGLIGRITPQGSVTELNTQSAPGAPEAITAGPDGNLWFTKPTSDVVGRITPSGTVSEFTDGITPLASPWDVAAGPDGAVWFTERVHRGIGRISPSGAVQEFTAGITDTSEPLDITLGADGNLWFTEGSGGRIGRITPLGDVTEFPVGTPGAQPLDIVGGPDGNLWFTEFQAHRIGRITTAGAVTEFPLVGAGNLIAAGPDGNLWFTEYLEDRIGRISTSGAVTEFPPRPAPSATPTPTPTPTHGPGGGTGGTPPPVAGVRVQARVLSGRVFVKLPPGARSSALDTGWHAFGAASFTPLPASASLPVGTVVDARKGVLAMTAATTAQGKLAAATLRAGIFRIKQRRANGRVKRPLDLVLAARASTAKACARHPRKGAIRSVSVVAKGLYRAVGGAATATATNATFTTQDRCTGTITRVTKGRVKVRDARKHKTVTVKAGHSYLAKARLFGARKLAVTTPRRHHRRSP